MFLINIYKFSKIYKRGLPFNLNSISNNGSFGNNLMQVNVTNYRPVSSQQLAIAYNMEDTMKKFHAEYPILKNDVLKLIPSEVAIEKFGEFFDYTMIGGRRLRALLLIKTFYNLASEYYKEKLSPSDIFTMAWMMEMVQALYIVNDDICDESNTRRGRKCWHFLHPKTVALDLQCINYLIFLLLRQKYGNTNFYDYVVNSLLDTHNRVYSGIRMDISGREAVKDGNFENYYCTTVSLKTEYMYGPPLRIALFLAGYRNLPYSNILENIYKKSGYWFQIMNDYLDLFGYGKNTGKMTYEDIRDGWITWFWVTALKYANEEQRKILQTRYGYRDEESVQAIYEVYEELNMREKYMEYEKQVKQEINNLINLIPDVTLKECLRDVIFKSDVYKFADIDLQSGEYKCV